ncbi:MULTISPECIES: hypothetical protein [Desulfovibrio]|uniref:Uncharacterized protein n=1 Tax=Desulfovibrio desulfuricans TaxID=876 RepID=A0AA94HV36_DESDE|nr:MULTISPECIES: hypothetical protein [Desulfovibrio]ATD81379.1 hypothetical protein CNY67_08290 [Desulfovibrio sp. G11]SFW67493.1 hypothetical protein SAMN02910291_02439 [Desulfovibrio desulfuricans]SPD37035.1 Hypothetical protein DSVG11_3008 [Desulfovibrio sp. G11]
MTKRRKTYAKERIESAINALDNMAKKAADSDNVKTRQAVAMMKKSIKAARKNGATWPEIMEALQASGVEISARTVMDMTNGRKKKEATQQKKAPVPAPAAEKKAPPVVPPGQFVIRPDRGADL